MMPLLLPLLKLLHLSTAPSGVAFGQASNVKPIKISASQLTKPINIAGIGRGGGKILILIHIVLNFRVLKVFHNQFNLQSIRHFSLVFFVLGPFAS